MKRSIFKGHLLDNAVSESIFESNKNGHFTKNSAFADNIKTLSQYGITDWEQLYALTGNDSIKNILRQTLKLQSDEELEQLRAIAASALPAVRTRTLDETDITLCPLGTRKPVEILQTQEKFIINNEAEIHRFVEVNKKFSEISAFSEAIVFQPANAVNLIHELPAIKSQGEDRGTCTAFAVTAANEHSYFKKTGSYPDLSEQYLYYETKALENDTFCGSWVRSAMQVITNKGQCQERTWSYNPNPPCVQQYGIPSGAETEATRYRNTFIFINQNDVQAIKQVLSSGRIVVFSIPTYNSWYHSKECYRTGRITMPLSQEPSDDGHTMAIVGYQDDAQSPGGGYFILRNSWGSAWAKDSYYGAGYGTIPYEYIVYYCWEAYSF